MLSLGQISGLLVILGVIPYLYEVFFRGVRPERITWFIWTAILAMSLFAQKGAGAEDSLWLMIGNVIACGIVFIASLFKGVGGFTKLDISCLTIAVSGVLIWQLSGNPLIAIFGSMIADFAGSLPTIKKAYIMPREEGATVYIFSLIASVIGFMAANFNDFAVYIFPIYLVLSNSSILTAKLLGHLRERQNSELDRA